ncbi:hypothetical protein GALL_77770 [mine drainage metagenome]|uniref:Uncharacterized protein n=1 Tax=mine drainage metagenome TaxID=410659 RepID=A0A1J5SPQ2_9ZZZZ
MKDLIEYIQREWTTIAAAPFTFVVVIVLVGGVAYAASKWRHGGIIELLRERLAAKDQQLDEYRERLHFVPAGGSEFAKLSHSELQTQALKFVGSLREWLAARHSQDSQRQHQQWLAMTRAADEGQKKDLWDSHTADLIQSSTALNSEYDAKFKVRAIVLRDEMLARVKHPNPKSHALHMYEHPTNPIGMGMVADDLELLARHLR